MSLPELLAPAGSIDCLTAAANAGADAVYMGGTRFGARAYADNPETADYLRAIDRLHLKNKKIYLTVNTLLKDREIEELDAYLKPFYECGIDGVIVQDVGVVKHIGERFKGLPIHLSTQMTLNTAEAAETIRALAGETLITRVVPSRELSLDEIKAFREGTDLELECFIHGALCYCYSGQCFMSSMFGGRSGNRGRCAQPCRLEYEMNGKKLHYLSPKDICTAEILADLIETGNDSFKIEGRMKGAGYVAGVTESYRRILDKYGELGKAGYRDYVKKDPSFVNDLVLRMQDLYNRGGFCHGFYDFGGGAQMMAMERSNHSGVKVGTVESVRGINAGIRLSRDVNPQDILEIRDGGKTLYDFTLGTGDEAGNILYSNFKSGSGVAPGNDVYRTRNNALLAELEENYLKNDRKVRIKGHFYFKTGEPMAFTCTCRGVSVTVTGPVVDAAKTSAATDENLIEKLSKAGETPFEFKKISVENGGSGFAPVSMLNNIRREALEKLEEEVLKSHRRVWAPEEDKEVPGERAESAATEAVAVESAATGARSPENSAGGTRVAFLVSTAAQLEAAVKSSADDIYIDITDISIESINDMCDMILEVNKRIFLALPRILRKDGVEKLSKFEGVLRNPAVSGYLLRNLDAYLMIADIAAKDGREIVFDHNLYVFNKEAKEFFGFGASGLTAPIELSGAEWKELGVTGLTIPVYGRLPLMVTAHCQNRIAGKCFKNEEGSRDRAPLILKDRMQKEMPVLSHCAYCFTTIHNSDTYTLAGSLSEIKKMAPSAVRLDFTVESAKETENAIKAFENEWENGITPDKSYLYRKTSGAFQRGTE